MIVGVVGALSQSLKDELGEVVFVPERLRKALSLDVGLHIGISDSLTEFNVRFVCPAVKELLFEFLVYLLTLFTSLFDLIIFVDHAAPADGEVEDPQGGSHRSAASSGDGTGEAGDTRGGVDPRLQGVQLFLCLGGFKDRHQEVVDHLASVYGAGKLPVSGKLADNFQGSGVLQACLDVVDFVAEVDAVADGLDSLEHPQDGRGSAEGGASSSASAGSDKGLQQAHSIEEVGRGVNAGGHAGFCYRDLSYF